MSDESTARAGDNARVTPNVVVTRALAVLAAVTLSACFIDSGPQAQSTETTGSTSTTTSGETTTEGTTVGPTTAATDTDTDTDTDGCLSGQEGCACDDVGLCEDPLVCVEELCQEPIPGGVCGDGEVNTGEGCDDANEIDGDGCNSCELGGTLIWQATHNGSAGSADFAWDVAVDTFANVYVVGYEVTADAGDNAWIGKYTSEGDLDWSHSIDSGAEGNEYALAVTVDSAGNPIVAGTRPSVSNNDAAWISAFDRVSGDLLWETGRNAETDKSFIPADMLYDSASEEVFVVGRVFNEGLSDDDAWIARFSSGGLVWEQEINAMASRDERGTGIVQTDDGDLIVCGYWPNPEDLDDRQAWARRIQPAGTEVWSQTYGIEVFESGNDCALTPGGTLFLTATVSTDDPGDSPETIAGHVVFRINPLTGEINNAPITVDIADGLGIAANFDDDQIVVAGDTPVVDMGLDIWLRKYDALNNPLWTLTHNANTGDSLDRAVSVTYDYEGNVIAAGGLGLVNGGVDIWVGKFSP